VSGVENIAEAFARARADGRAAALMPYMMGGFPDVGRSAEIADAYVEAGADLVELGVPFSDPLADGPVIHAAATEALGSGATLEKVLEIGGRIAAAGVPVVVMCYVNPILARGVERFVDMLAAAGASGLIVPDLPYEESEQVLSVCDSREIALVPLCAPTTPADRMTLIGRRARGFLYTVSLTGTTGERASVSSGLAAVVDRAKAHTGVPVAVGFGISSPEQAAAAAGAGADGVIVGSRLVRAAGEALDPAAAVADAVRALGDALTDAPNRARLR
jgi:tryptophan synthase alpha chain